MTAMACVEDVRVFQGEHLVKTALFTVDRQAHHSSNALATGPLRSTWYGGVGLTLPYSTVAKIGLVDWLGRN